MSAMARQKTSAEVQAIEEAQCAGESALAEVILYLRTAVTPTSEEAHKIIDTVLAELDCESPKGYIVAGGEQAVEPHEKGHGPISRGEAIVIDIFPRSKKFGYFADMTRTVCIGEPPPALQKMFDAVVAVQELAEKMVKPGVSCKSLQEAAEKYFTEHGFETSGKGTLFKYAEGFVHSVGHGVGKDIHEAPHISRKSEEVLMEGDVITNEPGLYYKGIGGIRMEDMLLVTKDGSRNLTKSPKIFVI
jgi:Xaa-Pro aminopeptidase